MQSCKVECIHLSLCCAYTQGYPYTLHMYICSSMPIAWSTFTQTLLYSTKCNTVTLRLPVYVVKYAVHGRQMNFFLFFLLAQQPDNGSWTPNPPPWQQVLRDVMFHGKKSPYLWPKGQSSPAIPLDTGQFWNSGVSLPVLTITVGPWGGQMNYLTLIRAMVKNEWRYTSTPPVCLHGLYKDNFTFTPTNFNFNNLVNESRSLILPL